MNPYAQLNVGTLPDNSAYYAQAGVAQSSHWMNSHKGQREMTREDLGLASVTGYWASTLTMLFIQSQRDLWKYRRDAPYAFWLGAWASA